MYGARCKLKIFANISLNQRTDWTNLQAHLSTVFGIHRTSDRNDSKEEKKEKKNGGKSEKEDENERNEKLKRSKSLHILVVVVGRCHPCIVRII